jgi:hypothetical protein
MYPILVSGPNVLAHQKATAEEESKGYKHTHIENISKVQW